ncbi:MAG: hypothetical protein F6K09_15560 [Merismopedia sp. SIO2A8]|nr:hypothetical protein [Merismopedia sp. SIO2A8]
MRFPKQVPPVQRPNPLKPSTLFKPHEALETEYRNVIAIVVEDTSKEMVHGKYPLKRENIASGKRLISVRVDLMHGCNFNDPPPYEAMGYEQLKVS